MKIKFSGLIILLIAPFFNNFASLGTTPNNFSCDELYYSFYYKYELLREVYKDFENHQSSCNRPVLEFLRNKEEEDENEVIYRSEIAYTVENKDDIFQSLKNMYKIVDDISLDELQQLTEDEANHWFEKNIKLPRLFTESEFQEKIRHEVGRLNYFLEYYTKETDQDIDSQDRKSYSMSIESAKSHFDVNWGTPILGQGASSTNPKGYYRIDLIGEPIPFDQSRETECHVIYRGFDQNTCEQDCDYLRNLAIDIQAKNALWKQEWDWENHKMKCTPQSEVKVSVIPFDAPFCQTSCPSSKIPCASCAYKIDKNSEEDYSVVNCLSEYDARHTANLYCYLNGGKFCEDLVCNTQYNIHAREPETVSSRTAIYEETSNSVKVGINYSLEGNAAGVGGGKNVNGEIEFAITNGIEVFSIESAPLGYRYYARREDGKLFECNADWSTRREHPTCNDIDILNTRINRKESSCKENEDEESSNQYLTFDRCRAFPMGDGRSFFSCNTSVDRVTSFSSQIEAGFHLEANLPLNGGAQLSIMGSNSSNFQVLNKVDAISKEFNAGGLTFKQMENTCQRWHKKWMAITFHSHVENDWIVKLHKSKKFDGSKIQLKTEENEEGTHVSCMINDTYGDRKRVKLSAIEGRLSTMTKDNLEAQKVFQLSFTINEGLSDYKVVEEVLNNDHPLSEILDNALKKNERLNDLLKKDRLYPPATPPMNKEYFSFPFKKEYSSYLTYITQGNLSASNIAKMLRALTPMNHGNFQIENCKVIERKLISSELDVLGTMQNTISMPHLTIINLVNENNYKRKNKFRDIDHTTSNE